MKRKIFYSITAVVVMLLVLTTCRRDVVDIPVESVSLDNAQTSHELNVGGSLTLVAVVQPDDAFNQFVRWKSTNTAVATVTEGDQNAKGVVSAVGPGTTTIIVTTEDGGFTATFDLTVIRVVASLTLNKSSLTLEAGTSEKLIATITPTDASDPGVEWTSSNPASAVVDNEGNVTAISATASPSAIITAKSKQDATKTASCQVSVTPAPIPVSGITLDKTTADLVLGSSTTSVTLTATISPTTATNRNLTWTSDNTAVATVPSVSTTNGGLTNVVNIGVAAGKAIITVSTVDGGYKATCTVTVTNLVVNVTSITFSPDARTMTIGESVQLTPIIQPTNATPTPIISWSSSNGSVASVSVSGVVNAISQGTATIIATSQNGVSGYCNITVSPLVTSVTLSQDTIVLLGNLTRELTASVNPSDPSSQGVDWTSADETIAKFEKLDTYGYLVRVIPVAPVGPTYPADGTKRTTTLTAKSKADPTKFKTCEVSVYYVAVAGVTVAPATKTLELSDPNNNTETLVASVSPYNASIQTVTWINDLTAPNVVLLGSTGNVKANQAGTATIKAQSVADVTKEGTCVITVNP